MSKEIFTVDLHCHPHIKAFNSAYPGPSANIWNKIHHKIEGNFGKAISGLSQKVLKESQSHLDAMAAGNVRVFQVSLYPIERGFLHLRNIPKFLIGKKRVTIMQEVITGYDGSCIAEQMKHYRYFEELAKEYAFVRAQQGKSPDGQSEFVLVNNYSELERELKKPNTLIGIISIEGAHVLGTGTPDTESIPDEELKQQLTEKIQAIKQWEFPPFMLNLAHHFWNHLSGHATSFKPPINSLINQNKGKNKEITKLGWHVIRELLSRENGKRILIDTKHMSAAARKQYYDFVGNYNSINPNDTIPVVSSHAGTNGFNTLDSSIKENDVISKTRTHKLYRWSINIPNDEARVIHNSGGLIGLMFDKGNLSGMQNIKRVTSVTDTKKQREEFSRIFWDNAFQIVKAIGEKSGWDTVAIGTDFDGSITHMDPYESSAKFPLFQHDLIEYLEENLYRQELWFGYSPDELVRKIMHANAMNFYKRFFV